MRFTAAILLLLTAALPAADLTLPPTVEGPVGSFIAVPAETDGEVVRWHAIDAGLNLFPIDLLKDTRTAVVTSSRAGRFRLLAYTSIDNVPSEPAVVTVIVGNAPEPGPQPDPDPIPPTPVPDLTGVAKIVYTASRGIDKAVLQQAANAYGSQVSAINAGAYNAVSLDAAKQQIVTAIVQGNPPREKAPALFAAIDGQLQAAEEANRLGTLAAVSALLADIVTGLEAASR